MGIATAVAALAGAGGAQAYDGAIAQDLKDGRLDGTYTRAQMSSYLQSAMAQGYGNPVVTPPAAGVAGAQSPTAAQPATPAATPASGSGSTPANGVAGEQSPSPLAATQQTGTLPFTGLDLALLAAGGAFLLGLGLIARRLGRN